MLYKFSTSLRRFCLSDSICLVRTSTAKRSKPMDSGCQQAGKAVATAPQPARNSRGPRIRSLPSRSKSFRKEASLRLRSALVLERRLQPFLGAMASG